jgi:hypothetical protein
VTTKIWYSPHTNRKFPVDSKIKSRDTANGVLKQAGLGPERVMPFASAERGSRATT